MKVDLIKLAFLNALLSFFLYFPLSANADIAITGEYNASYAQDFAKCPEHFYHNTPPSLDLPTAVQADLYPLCYNGFAVLYAGVSKTALYSAEHLTDKRLQLADKLERVDSFRPENRLPNHLQIDPKRYQGTGFDKGHLAPNADMPTADAQYDSFSLANIAPQNAEHNRKIWRHIETHIRHLTRQFGESFVITGVLFNGEQVAMMNGVFVPTHFYKAVYFPNKNMGIVYYSPNDESGTYRLLSFEEFYQLTGIEPFKKSIINTPNPSTSNPHSVFSIRLPTQDQDTKTPPSGVLAWVRTILVAIGWTIGG